MKKISRIAIFSLLLLVLGRGNSYAQQNQVVLDYIDAFKELAVEEMQRTGVPASIKLAQGIHETMAGTSVLVRKSNNHFGIKCKTNWTGQSVSHDDDARGECFRKYPSATDSYRDHSDFLKNGARYASLFELDPVNYAEWAYGLKKAGYATNPKYPAIIIKIIEDYHLQDYTLIAMGKMSPRDIMVAKNETPATTVMATTAVIAETEIPRTVYPTGEFRINDTRVVFIQKGTAYLAIARQYNVSLGRLFEFNELEEAETAAEDQLVFLQRKRKMGNEDFHVVMTGESLHDIAQQQGIRLETLQEYNWLRGDMQPAVGEKLYLKAKATAMPRLAQRENYSLSSPVEKRLNIN